MWNDKELKLLICSGVILAMMTYIIGYQDSNRYYKNILIKNNLAEYQINPKTGVSQFVLLTNQCNHVKTKE